jgi:hypothetical protein
MQHPSTDPIMDVATTTQHPREILQQVATSMNDRHDELSVTIPVSTTWKEAIDAATAAVGNVNESITIIPPERHARGLALENTSFLNRELPESGSQIRPNTELGDAGPPPESENANIQLMETVGPKPHHDPVSLSTMETRREQVSKGSKPSEESKASDIFPQPSASSCETSAEPPKFAKPDTVQEESSDDDSDDDEFFRMSLADVDFRKFEPIWVKGEPVPEGLSDEVKDIVNESPGGTCHTNSSKFSSAI